MKSKFNQRIKAIKPNHILVPGVVLFCLILVDALFIQQHFEIRILWLSKLVGYLKVSLFFLSTCAILGGALMKPGVFKWFFIAPFIIVFLGVILFVFLYVFIPREDDLWVKPETVLYQYDENVNKKIVYQTYWTGIAGGNFNEDTLVVFEFTSWLRTIKKFEEKKLNEHWVPVNANE